MPAHSTKGLPKPATADSGFVLSLPPLENPFTSDAFLLRILSWYLPKETFAKAQRELAPLGDEAISAQITEWNGNAEKQVPYVKGYNVWGERYGYDQLVTGEGWKELGKWGARTGSVALGYEPEYGNYKRIVQFTQTYIYSPVSGLTSCPVAMTDGAARLLSQFTSNLPPSHPFHEAYRRLTARTDAWTSGQWMTERAGGSDVQNTETWARYSPLPKKTGEYGRIDEGDYLVSGFKFFSSATDANMTILLAKTESGKLSTFLAPLRKTIIDSDGKERVVANGVRIHRLKNKLGTKQLPTAELELKDMRAHLVGPLDQGVPTISYILNITRAHTFMSSAAGWRRAVSIAKSFAKARTTLDQPLWAMPLHLRTLAEIEIKLRGCLHLGYFTISLMSFVENSFPAADPAAKYAPMPKAGNEAQIVLRTLTAVAKAVVSKNAVYGIQECMESMGGVGYMDEADESEHNVARILRDMNVNAIWEGTTNVLASELIRHILKKNHLEIFSGWLQRAINGVENPSYRDSLDKSWQNLNRRLSGSKNNVPEALANGRRLMFSLAWIVIAMLLATDAQRDGDEVAKEIARRWIVNGEGGVGEWKLPDVGVVGPDAQVQEGLERAKWDCRIVWGVELPKNAATGQRIVKAKI